MVSDKLTRIGEVLDRIQEKFIEHPLLKTLTDVDDMAFKPENLDGYTAFGIFDYLKMFGLGHLAEDPVKVHVSFGFF